MSPTSTFVPFGRRLRSLPVLSALGVLLVLLAVWLFWGGESTAQDKPLWAPVVRGDIENTVSAAGSLAPSNSVEVGAQVSGQLQKLLVDVGDVVVEGQHLASIDASVQLQEVEARRASLQALEAQMSGRQAAVQLAEANAKRQQNMIKERATSQQEVDSAINTLVSAQSNLAQLQAQIQQSRASLASSETELGYSKIYAPMAGTVVSITIKEGQTLNASQNAPTVLTLADLTAMTVETDVSEADVNKLRPNMEVYFTTLGGGKRRWYGSLQQILPTPEIVNNVVLYTALFDVDNQDQALLNGMTAQVFFVTSAARDVLTIPVAALRNLTPIAASQTQSASVTVMRNGKAEERQIVVGISSRVAAEVLSGLHEGDQVVAGVVQNHKASAPAGGSSMRGFR
jgi:macrolide-specific efflux system membrane fusion protein